SGQTFRRTCRRQRHRSHALCSGEISMSDSFSLAAYLAQGDFVSHAVAIILIVLSISSWVVIGAKILQIYRQHRQSAQLDKNIRHASYVDDGLNTIPPAMPFAFAAH